MAARRAAERRIMEKKNAMDSCGKASEKPEYNRRKQFCREAVMRLERLHLLRRLYIQKTMPEHDLYFGQLPLLEYVCRHEGCTQIEMAQALDVTPASIAVSTKRLQKAGLLTKETDEDDLRLKRLSPTEEGRARAKRGRELFTELDQRSFEGFTEEEFQQLTGLLDRIAKNLGNAVRNKSGLEAVPLHKLAEELYRNGPAKNHPGKNCDEEEKLLR
jgi:DNA-binding MarR family transcriptional regulator